jgi:hypothetical protein
MRNGSLASSFADRIDVRRRANAALELEKTVTPRLMMQMCDLHCCDRLLRQQR